MELDKFKNYIDQHREEFEDASVPAFSFAQIQQKMEQRKRKKTIRLWTRLAAAAAVVCVISISLFNPFSSISTTDTKLANQDIQPAFTQPLDPVLIEKKVEAEPSSTYMELSSELVKSKKEQSLAQKPAELPRNNYAQLIEAIQDSSSTANRLAATLEIGKMGSLNSTYKKVLCQTFQNDESQNVRLAALDILADYQHEEAIKYELNEAIYTEDDPIVQMELVRIIGDSEDMEMKNNLFALVKNSETIEPVKKEVFQILVENQPYHL